MIRHFWLDKTATIIKGTKFNTGLNPILKLNYGRDVTRGLIHFDIDEMSSLVCDKTFADTDKLSFHLKMTNCMSVDGLPYEKNLIRNNLYITKRASSFDLILFELPQPFDAGRGYSYETDFWIGPNQSYTEHGCSWYFSKDGQVWLADADKVDIEDPNVNYATIVTDYHLNGGIYKFEDINNAVKAYERGEESFIVGMQHFDFGDENLDIDITDYVLDLISGKKKNNGLCLAFAPLYETIDLKQEQFVGFFTDHTNTFFHPYVEAVYDEYVTDDRESCYLGKVNKLYFYASVDGYLTNLDEMPKCEIDGVEYEVRQATKGIYYIEYDLRNSDIEPETIKYDVWSNLFVDGNDFGEVENEFVVLPKEKHFKLGSETLESGKLVPTVTGIAEAERLGLAEKREVHVDFRREFTTDKKELINGGEFRLYVHDANRDLDVLPYTKIEKSFLNNFFIINTADLIPNKYYVDIRVKAGNELRYYKEVLRFEVVSNVTERYH